MNYALTIHVLYFHVVLQYPSIRLQLQFQIQLLWVQISVHGKFYNKESSHARHKSQNPTFCCTQLKKYRKTRKISAKLYNTVPVQVALFCDFNLMCQVKSFLQILKNVNSNDFLQHLKQILCHLQPPATFSSAAKTDRSHLGHFGASGALKGMFKIVYLGRYYVYIYIFWYECLWSSNFFFVRNCINQLTAGLSVFCS